MLFHKHEPTIKIDEILSLTIHKEYSSCHKCTEGGLACLQYTYTFTAHTGACVLWKCEASDAQGSLSNMAMCKCC